jgi:hypothetical protein
MFGRSQPETRSQIAHAPSTRSIPSARVSDCRGVGWKAGFEIELMAPRVASRPIEACVSPAAASVRSGASSIPQKPSKVPGSPTFENPTLGFEAVDTRGRPITRFVDETPSSEFR